MKTLTALIEESQKGVTGTARLSLYKGSAIVTGRKSPNSLYSAEVASFEGFETYNSEDAGGFIRMNGLRLTLNPTLRDKG